MKIIKRDGTSEEVKFDKVLKRVKDQARGLKGIDAADIAKKVINQLKDGISSSEIDTLLADSSAVLADKHPNFETLAARIAISAHHKETLGFYETMKKLIKSKYSGDVLMGEEFERLVKSYGKELEEYIDYNRDYNIKYFGFKILENSYLLKIDGKPVERPQDMYMRVALEIGRDDLDRVKATYDLMSAKKYTHATPTLYNSGLKNNQLSSCFLLNIQGDSIEGIYDTLKECAMTSKLAGGIGLAIHDIRAKGSKIKGTNGTSNGIVPMLKVFNETANYVDQGGGKRKGSFAIYLEPWHADIEAFVDLKLPTGSDELRARDLFTAIFANDLFMKRVEEDADWTLFCPSDVRDLSELYDGKEKKAFTEAYEKYEAQGLGKKVIKAKDLWTKIIESQADTGVPYVVFKDACNDKCNQKHSGMVHSSNLCVEITEVTSEDESSVCNLASVNLSQYVKKNTKGEVYFDHKSFGENVELIVENLNTVIDINRYPVEKMKRSNNRHRPIGLGWQGLADVFIKFKIPYGSERALHLDREIAETMYYHALRSSCRLAKKDGHYETFPGSPASKGILQFDMWDEKPSDRFDWKALKEDIKSHGLRNSLLIALMPTASTASIFGSSASFEPIPFIIGKREVLAGEFLVVNDALVEILEELKLWNDDMRDEIVANRGSIQGIESIPQEVKDIFKTSFEYKQKTLIDHARARAPFVCQSMSMNLFWSDISFSKLHSALMYAWKQGLKTGSYYMRSKAKMEARMVTVKKKNSDVKTEESQQNTPEVAVCSLDNPDCDVCGA